MTSSILWSAILAIHLLSMAYWVGGAFYCTQTIRSTVKVLDPGHAQAVQLQSYTRFFRALWHVAPLSLISGGLLLFNEGGFASVGWPIHLMALLGILMALLFLATYFGPFRKARRAMRPQAALFQTLYRRTSLTTVLGFLTVIAATLSRHFF